jgi:esterase FrsA
MSDLPELKNFALLHARALGLDPAEAARVRDRITHDEGSDTPGSWVAEWSSEAAGRELVGDLPGAVSRYLLAAFPYARDLARGRARGQALTVFNRWQRVVPGVERLVVPMDGGVVTGWATGLDAAVPRPLLIATGGIISPKEQWAPFLRLAQSLGMAALVTEMPGVGENSLPYDSGSHAMYGALLDALAGRADTDRTLLVALSFSGHLALRQAAVDRRIRGVVTVGAPVSAFFTDAEWWPRLPRLTRDTLAHLTGQPPETLFDHLSGWALTPDELAGLDIPVGYVQSLRDEVVPNSDAQLLLKHVDRCEVLSFDDVHGSPAHIDHVRTWIADQVRMMNGAGAGRGEAALGTLSGLDEAARPTPAPRPAEVSA